MKFTYCLLGVLICLVSCSSRHAVHVPPLTSLSEKINCGKIYPQGKWQFVHSLEFSLADGKKGSAIGVSVIDEPVIECALMTIEGFILFQARYDKELEIIRAVPPFDNREFAGGLISDLQLIFFKPPAEEIISGKLADGSRLCRYLEKNGQCADIVFLPDHGWEINQYGPDKSRRRTITARVQPESRQWRPPEYLELKADDFSGYTLKMTLLSAEKIAAAYRPSSSIFR